MILSTVHAIREIKRCNRKNILFNVEQSTILSAMIASLKYHSLKITREEETMIVEGVTPVPF